MLEWNEASEIVRTVDEEVADDPALLRLRKEWRLCAVRYAQVRAQWQLAPRTERLEMDANRTRLHDAFIDACNALSRRLRAEDKDVGWRRALGDDRKRIGDLACYLHCVLGLQAR